METNSKNCQHPSCCYEKRGRVSPVWSVVLEECTDSCIFLLFVKILLQKGVLSRGDICVVDNYTVHTKGDNISLQEELVNHHGVFMIKLPPIILIWILQISFLKSVAKPCKSLRTIQRVYRRNICERDCCWDEQFCTTWCSLIFWKVLL